MREATPQRSGAAAAGLAVVLALTWWAYRPVLAWGHLGWDTWPLLLASRVASTGELLGTFGEPLMDGLYPHGAFYRPLLHLSVALDHGLWGVAPFGYHLTDLLLLLLATGAVFAVGRRLAGDAWAALAAAALFALHPLHFESLPATARRADMLAGLFTLLALWRLPRPGEGRGLGAALLALAAVASKESGAVAAPLLAVLAFAERAGAPGERAREALRAAGPALLLLLGFVVLRAGVLGGMGGHAGTSFLGGLLRAPGLALLFAPLLTVPQPAGALPQAAGLVLAALLALALVGLARRDPRLGRAALVPLAWALLLLLLSGVSGDLAPWYAPTLLPAWGLLVGLLVAGLHGASPVAATPLRVAGAVLACALVLLPLRYSGLFERYGQWAELSAESERFLIELEARIEALPPEGGTLRVSGLPERSPRGAGVGVHGAAGLGGYSLPAWAAFAVPEREVVLAPVGSPEPAPGRVALVIEGAAAP